MKEQKEKYENTHEYIIVFLVSGVTSFLLSLLTELSMRYVILSGIIVGILAIIIIKCGNFITRSPYEPKGYPYKWQQTPFGDWHYFTVDADNQDEADEKARQHFEMIVKNNLTVTTTFYRVN